MSKTPYEVIVPIRTDPDPTTPPAARGSVIELKDKDAAPLLKNGTIRILPGDARATATAIDAGEPVPLPLEDLTVAALGDVAKAEAIDLDGAKVKADKVARIQAVRAVRATFAAQKELGKVEVPHLREAGLGLSIEDADTIELDVLAEALTGALATTEQPPRAKGR